ncbi:MAG: SDR family NAD(P)-dependent oxidoreductase, partial [Candidatus Bathyarchaeota archaeon]
MFKDIKVVVTGGAGFIGSHLCKRLVDKGAKVNVIDNLSSGKLDNIKNLMDSGLKFVQGDIRDPEKIEQVAKNSEIIFHLAAQSSVPFSMENPKEDCEINVVGTVNVLEAARKIGAKVVFASSSAVYGNPKIKPTPETYPTNPIAFYGLTKLLGEKYCLFYKENFGSNIVILRIFNVYGPNCHGAIYDFLNKLRKNPEKLEVLGTGRQSRDFIYVSDMVDFLLKAAISPTTEGEIFNVGTGKTTSVSELAKIIVDLLGLKDVDIFFKGGQAWEGDMDITLADNSKAMVKLEWKPQIS